MLSDLSDIDREIDAILGISATKEALAPILRDYHGIARRIAESDTQELAGLEQLVRQHLGMVRQWSGDETVSRYLRREREALERLRALLGSRLRKSRAELHHGRYEANANNANEALTQETPLQASTDSETPFEMPYGMPQQPQHPNAASGMRNSEVQRAEFLPTLDTIVEHYRAKGLVGEESTCIVQTLGAIHLMNFGIESLSGSGKTHMADMLIELLPEGAVYRMGLSSNTAEMYDAEQINRCSIIYIPELQKAMRTTNPNPIMVEVLKSITEGKDATRKVRDQNAGVNRQYTITAGKGVIFTLAIENDFRYDAELSRRVFVLYTDVSEEQTERVLRYKAARRHAAPLERQAANYHGESMLKAHIAQCMDMRFSYENPFADRIAESVPRTIRARSYADYLFGLIEASAKFHHKSRLVEKDALFISLEDVHEVYAHYWKQFVMGLLRVPLLGEQALAAFEPGLPMEAQEAYERMKGPSSSPSPAYSFHLVKNTLEGLAAAGMLEKDDQESRRPLYVKAKELPLEPNIDWQQCFRAGAAYMYATYPQIAEKWLGMQAGFLKTIGLIQNE
ncbi:hypothetical protein HYV82_02875 [Candidatus Woesearchaeota archaeon]|nr:hypothetical protein [Candidatus Woesearchaeota archaeon]